jgi:threonine dehydrogenase-like Zn-dependent dehydrogenase
MVPETYKGWIFHGKEDIEFKELAMPACGDDDVLVKTLYASLCGSEIAVYQYGLRGERIVPDKEFGHEAVVEAVAVGKNVKDIKVGDRLAPFPQTVKRDRSIIGAIGAFSEYMLFPKCVLNESVLRLPENVDPKVGVFSEPFSVGLRAAKNTEPKPSEAGVIFGAGAIGCFCALYLKHMGVKDLLVVDISDLRLKGIGEVGGFKTFNCAKGDWAEYAKEQFGEATGFGGAKAPNVDFMVDAVGSYHDPVTGFDGNVPHIFQLNAKHKGRLTVVGKHSAGPEPIDFLRLYMQTQTIRGSGGYIWEDVEDSLAYFASGEADLTGLVTHVFAHKDLPEALMTGRKVHEAQKVLIQYG